MTKTRGILIAIVVVVAAIGAVLWLRGRDRPASKAAATQGSAHSAAVPRDKVEPARLVVTVSDAKGPIAGATVRLERDRGEVTVAQAGRDGVARAEGLEPGTWHVSAAADGHEPAAVAPRELHAGETVNIEIKLAAGGRTLTGTVTDVSGGPIPGARIDAAKLGGLARPSDAVATTLTGTDGKYKLTVAEGQLLVAASESSYAPQSRYVDVGANGATADFQLVPGGVIEGVVRDEHTREPVPGAMVIAERDAPAMMLGERARHRVTAGNDGRFRITGLRPGAYELGARAARLASHSPTVIGIGVAEQVTDVEILVGNSPVVRGIVVDEHGAPAPNVEVSAFGPDRGDTSATSNAKGVFAIEGLAAGTYMLIGRGDNFLPAGPTRVEIDTKDVDGIKVNVRRGIEIKGHVERRQICEVELVPDERRPGRAGDMPMIMMGAETTGPDGNFSLGPAHETAYDVKARCPNGEQGTKSIDAKAGMGDVVVEVKPGASIAGRVVDGKGKPVAGVSVMATPKGDSEHTMIVNGMVTSGMQALANASGEFEIRGLAAATYRLRVLDRGRPLPMKTESKVTVAASEHKTGVSLTVDRPDGVIRGVVVGADGKPLADAWVSLHQDLGSMIEGMGREDGESHMVTMRVEDDGGESNTLAPALTDSTGKFELTGLPRIPFTVVAEAQAGKVRGRATRVVPDAQIEIKALGVTELRGVVRAPTGVPSSFHVEIEGPTDAERDFATKDGTFSFARVDAGDYTVTVTSSAGNGRATVKVVPGQAAQVEVPLVANAVVVGKLADSSGKPLGGLPLAIVPDEGDGRMKVEMTGPPPTSNPDGSFRLEAKAGRSALLVLTPPRPTQRRGLVLEAGKTLDVGTITVDTAPAK